MSRESAAKPESATRSQIPTIIVQHHIRAAELNAPPPPPPSAIVGSAQRKKVAPERGSTRKEPRPTAWRALIRWEQMKRREAIPSLRDDSAMLSKQRTG
ncbi:hypothetical protein VTH82DRAFT_8584 [Thermothelomyces myriococcoides]